MTYIDVAWRHGNSYDPVRLVRELDERGMETRKLEFFPDGRVGYASRSGSNFSTRLGDKPIPPLHQVNEDPEFSGVSMDETEFERLWRKHAKK
jgi:uncharacterized protein DUF6881